LLSTNGALSRNLGNKTQKRSLSDELTEAVFARKAATRPKRWHGWNKTIGVGEGRTVVVGCTTGIVVVVI
jgi:hypothetical protein